MARSPLRVSAALVLASHCALPRVEASPPATPQIAATAGEDATGSTGAALAGGEAPTDTTGATTTTDTTDTETPDPTAGDPVHEQFAVPLPGPRRGDKQLRRDRGMLAAGIVFAALCGAGIGLGVWALVDRRSRTAGRHSADGVASVTGLLSCTVGALAVASVGAMRLKRRRRGR